MAKFQMTPRIGTYAEPARAGTKAAPLTDADTGKAVKLAGESQIDLAGDGDEIFGFLSSVEPGTQDGFVIGGFAADGYMEVDTGAVPVGSLVVVASNPARGTAGKTVVKAVDEGTHPTFRWMVVHPGLIRRV